jgi:hypothetical protein
MFAGLDVDEVRQIVDYYVAQVQAMIFAAAQEAIGPRNPIE